MKQTSASQPTETVKKAIYSQCERFLNGNYPRSLKSQLEDLAAHTEQSELADVYGKGALIEGFETEVATLLGKPAALFLPSGTMAQLIALRIWCDRRKKAHFAMHATSHLALHEQNAYEHLHHLKATFLGDPKKGLTLSDFENSDAAYAAALIELPQRELGGTLPEWNDLTRMSEFCRSNSISFHLDGARLWETAPYYKKSYAEISALFDSVYVSFYKGLGGITGAALAGPVDFIEEARIWQRRYGGNLYRLFPYVISAREALHRRLPKMSAYHEKAVELAKALSVVEGLNIEPQTPQTNMMHITFERSASEIETAFLQIAADEKIAGFFRAQPHVEPDKCKVEFTVGDATLDLSTDEILRVFKKAISSV